MTFVEGLSVLFHNNKLHSACSRYNNNYTLERKYKKSLHNFRINEDSWNIQIRTLELFYVGSS